MTKILYNSENEDTENEDGNQSIGEDQPKITPSSKKTAPSSKKSKQIKEQQVSQPELKEDKPKKERPIKEEKEKQVHQCPECYMVFTRNAFLNKHIQELRCPVYRDIAKRKEMELKEIEQQLNEKMLKIKKRQEKKQLKEMEQIKQPKPTKPKNQEIPEQPLRPPNPQPQAPIQRQLPIFKINF